MTEREAELLGYIEALLFISRHETMRSIVAERDQIDAATREDRKAVNAARMTAAGWALSDGTWRIHGAWKQPNN